MNRETWEKIEKLPFSLYAKDLFDSLVLEIKDGVVEHKGQKYFYHFNDRQPKRPADGVAYVSLYWADWSTYYNHITRDKKTAKLYKDSLKSYQPLVEAFPNLKVPCFGVKRSVDFTVIPKLDDLYIYPFERKGLDLDYSASYRTGLEISFGLSDLLNFLSNYYQITYNWKDITEFTPEFSLYLDSCDDSEIREILSFCESKYNIEDEESYGEYSLRNINLRKDYLEQLNKAVEKLFLGFKGQRYKAKELI